MFVKHETQYEKDLKEGYLIFWDREDKMKKGIPTKYKDLKKGYSDREIRLFLLALDHRFRPVYEIFKNNLDNENKS